jgi:pimeloyl-ACP methyl ester carboxylesterase
MPVVLVHGVPDTHRVWNKLTAHLDRTDIIAVSLPGFGCPIPPGFTPTKDAYAAWLANKLESINNPIDLVAHDWGCILALRAMMLKPGLVRTWAVGGAPLDAEYVWHETAQLWQTPGVGEKFMSLMNGDAIIAALTSVGVPQEDAEEASKHMDDTMRQSILALYRSALTVGQEWEGDLAKITAPGIVIWGENDPYAATKFGSRLASKTHADYLRLAACGHWWQLERPKQVALALNGLWAR